MTTMVRAPEPTATVTTMIGRSAPPTSFHDVILPVKMSLS